MDKTRKRVIAISAINFFEGGPLSILNDCLTFLNNGDYTKEYKIIALVHKKELFDLTKYPNIEFLAFPKSRQSYIYRLYYEYIFFKKFATQRHINFWLSLHDITPNLKKNINQAVYCHNASPFNSVNLIDIILQPTQLLFSLFYKHLYAINIKRNKKIIVQQQWMKKEFQKMFSLDENQIIVAPPQVPKIPQKYLHQQQIETTNLKTFFFPTFPRPFKNIEVIGEAIKLLNKDGFYNFKVIITIDGSENRYAKTIFKKYNLEKNIEFIGLIKREAVYDIYSKTDCLIFPSKLESWGLPISEFKQFDKPLFVADLPYAHESVSNYDKAAYFNPSNASQLANLMKDLILSKNMPYNCKKGINRTVPYAENWGQLFSILLN